MMSGGEYRGFHQAGQARRDGPADIARGDADADPAAGPITAVQDDPDIQPVPAIEGRRQQQAAGSGPVIAY